MKVLKLNTIDKKFFGFLDIAKILGISPASARVAAHRYVENGILVRIKPNIFVLTEKWKYFSMENRFEAANLVQVPSYISLTTALAYYGITTQIQRNYIECISIKRSLVRRINEVTIRYSKLSEKLYCAFEKRAGFYIAVPEKALMDAVYLTSLGRYSLDVAAIDTSRLNQEVLIRFSELYPENTKKMMRVHGFISPA